MSDIVPGEVIDALHHPVSDDPDCVLLHISVHEGEYEWLLNQQVTIHVGSELEAIVRDLAATETPFDDLDCHLCGVYRYRTEERETVEVTIHEHETDCPWRLAVEWVSAHPVSGDQP